MGNCHPSKTNVNLGFASVDIGNIMYIVPKRDDHQSSLWMIIPTQAFTYTRTHLKFVAIVVNQSLAIVVKKVGKRTANIEEL